MHEVEEHEDVHGVDGHVVHHLTRGHPPLTQAPGGQLQCFVEHKRLKENNENLEHRKEFKTKHITKTLIGVTI